MWFEPLAPGIEFPGGVLTASSTASTCGIGLPCSHHAAASAPTAPTKPATRSPVAGGISGTQYGGIVPLAVLIIGAATCIVQVGPHPQVPPFADMCALTRKETTELVRKMRPEQSAGTLGPPHSLVAVAYGRSEILGRQRNPDGEIRPVRNSPFTIHTTQITPRTPTAWTTYLSTLGIRSVNSSFLKILEDGLLIETRPFFRLHLMAAILMASTRSHFPSGNEPNPTVGLNFLFQRAVSVLIPKSDLAIATDGW